MQIIPQLQVLLVSSTFESAKYVYGFVHFMFCLNKEETFVAELIFLLLLGFIQDKQTSGFIPFKIINKSDKLGEAFNDKDIHKTLTLLEKINKYKDRFIHRENPSCFFLLLDDLQNRFAESGMLVVVCYAVKSFWQISNICLARKGIVLCRSQQDTSQSA